MIRMLGMLLVFFTMCFNFAVAYRSAYKDIFVLLYIIAVLGFI